MIPAICLGICVMLITTEMLYWSMTEETQEGLKNLAYSFYQSCSLTGNGDYGFADGKLTKGGAVFDEDASLVDSVYRVSGVDANLFWGDTRALTTIHTADGARATGTQAAPQVVQAVLDQGEDYFSDHVMVNGTSYFGYYMPLKNSDGSNVGMVFVGKARSLVVKSIQKAVLLIFLVLAAVIAVTSAISLRYAKKIIYSLNRTKEFLGQVAQGDVESRLEPRLLERDDEIGEMGRFAAVLQKSITDLVGTDSLTGLGNRRSCNLILANAMKEYRQYQTPFAIAMGDIDNFKTINDQFGHQGGDDVLRKLSMIFLEHMAAKAMSPGGAEKSFYFFMSAWINSVRSAI